MSGNGNAHGHCKRAYKSRTYRSWGGMRQRCQNPKDAVFHRYGARGISVCKRWEKFENFLMDMGEKPKGLQLDRINNDGDYKPSNCRWATTREQNRNKATNRFFTLNGKTMCLIDWARHAGLSRTCLTYRLDVMGWPLDIAIATPSKYAAKSRGGARKSKA